MQLMRQSGRFKSLMLEFLLLLEYLACNDYTGELSCVVELVLSSFGCTASVAGCRPASGHRCHIGLKTASSTTFLIIIALQAARNRPCMFILVTDKSTQKCLERKSSVVSTEVEVDCRCSQGFISFLNSCNLKAAILATPPYTRCEDIAATTHECV